ncbi:MAG: hypothetical protein KDI08_07505 [Pseudomonadales bacterium]|nr:hypothetical protein [Pseudomonadales bacterium]
MKAEEHDLPRQWWGDFAVADGESLYWQIGPMQLQWVNAGSQWRCAYRRLADVDDESTVGWQLTRGDATPAFDENPQRFVFSQPMRHATVLPALADRSVITRPTTALTIPPRQSALLLFSTPLWFQLRCAGVSQPLFEVPISRPSDTWFGPSTCEGELAYASRTHARLQGEALPPRPHRAVTPVRIENRIDAPLLIERISLPVTLLSLFVAADGMLWTEEVTLRREQAGEMAALQVGQGAPLLAQAATLVQGPRNANRSGILLRAFAALFH